MAWSSRTCARLGALLAVPVLAALTASPASATPAGWPEPEPMSTLYAIGLFVGGPAALFVVIALLTMAPSVVKGPRYRPGLPWYAEAERFGTLPAAAASDAPPPGAAPSSGMATQGGGARGGW